VAPDWLWGATPKKNLDCLFQKYSLTRSRKLDCHSPISRLWQSNQQQQYQNWFSKLLVGLYSLEIGLWQSNFLDRVIQKRIQLLSHHIHHIVILLWTAFLCEHSRTQKCDYTNSGYWNEKLRKHCFCYFLLGSELTFWATCLKCPRTHLKITPNVNFFSINFLLFCHLFNNISNNSTKSCYLWISPVNE
jgi:hypothetical protein